MGKWVDIMSPDNLRKLMDFAILAGFKTVVPQVLVPQMKLWLNFKFDWKTFFTFSFSVTGVLVWVKFFLQSDQSFFNNNNYHNFNLIKDLIEMPFVRQASEKHTGTGGGGGSKRLTSS